MLQFKHLLSVPFFIMNKYMTEHVVFNVNAGNYHWNIYQELLLEYAVLPRLLGTWMLQFKHLLSVPFFYHGKISRNYQHNDTYLNLVLLYMMYMMLLIKTAGWKITSCRKKIKKHEWCLIIFLFFYASVAIANCFMYKPLVCITRTDGPYTLLIPPIVRHFEQAITAMKN